jgi:hypothetical protein
MMFLFVGYFLSLLIGAFVFSISANLRNKPPFPTITKLGLNLFTSMGEYIVHNIFWKWIYSKWTLNQSMRVGCIVLED